ncbi:MAG: hypothetical protein P1V97_20015, partial [Planctomycetota bacterium]|nr:hypothetical protein [Planctomycetota bacterium]
MLDRQIEQLKRRVTLGDERVRHQLQIALHRAGRFVAEAWAGLPITVDFEMDKLEKRYGSRVAGLVSETLSYLDVPRLISHLPVTKKGDLKLKQSIFIEHLGLNVPQKSTEVTLWLVARTPNFKAQGRIIHISVQKHSLIRSTLRWNRCPWLWDHRVPLYSSTAWGSSEVDFNCLNQSEKSRLAQARELQKRVAVKKGTLGERVTLYLLLMSLGRVSTAFKLFSIDIDVGLQKALKRETLRSVYPDDTNCRELLYYSAPWRFHDLIEREEKRRKNWPKCPARLNPNKGVTLGLHPFAGAPYWQNSATLWLTLRRLPGRKRLIFNSVGARDLVDVPLG